MSGGTLLDRFLHVLFLLSLAFLFFVAGGMLVLNQTFPSGYLKDAYRAGLAVYYRAIEPASPYATNLWARARTEAAGVTYYDPERAYDGLTLYTSGHAHKAFLIAMDGTVVHEWQAPFSAIWDETAAIQTPQPDRRIYVENSYLYPNGDLLLLYAGLGDTPWGYGLVKVDRDSNVIFKYLQQAHHDLDVAEDGRIYLLTHEIGSNVIEYAEHLEPPRVDDFVVVLSPDGKELRKISILDAFVRSRYLRLLSTVAWYAKGDFLHTNAIEVINEAGAKALPFARPGQVLLSFRDMGVIALLDLDKEEIVWALRGPWLGQHDPDVLANGNILLFDNLGHYGNGGTSRVIEFDPVTLEIVWIYAGDGEHRFESAIRSNQQRLPNGNTLITESDASRLLEVAPDREIVWEFVNPVRGGDGDAFLPVVFWGQRIEPATLEAGFRNSLSYE